MVEQVEIKEAETTSEKPTEEKQERPEWLPEKFGSPEDMAKAYGELENKLGQPTADKEQETTTQESKSEDTLEIAEKAVSDAGLDMSVLQSEYSENGQLKDTSYEALQKAGIPKDYVDQFIKGQEALRTAQSNDIKGIVGGDESYNNISQWASENLSEPEKQAYNKVVNSNDIESIKLAVTGLKARYDSANGTEPNLVKGKAATTGAQGYQSWAQVTEAMADPKYAKDPAYQAMVKDKLAVSNI
jgi:hypothetical protein